MVPELGSQSLCARAHSNGVGPNLNEPWVPFAPVCRGDHWRTAGVGLGQCQGAPRLYQCVLPITGGLWVWDPVSAKGHQGATGEIVGITWPTLVLGEVEPT